MVIKIHQKVSTCAKMYQEVLRVERGIKSMLCIKRYTEVYSVTASVESIKVICIIKNMDGIDINGTKGNRIYVGDL